MNKPSCKPAPGFVTDEQRRKLGERRVRVQASLSSTLMALLLMGPGGCAQQDTSPRFAQLRSEAVPLEPNPDATHVEQMVQGSFELSLAMLQSADLAATTDNLAFSPASLRQSMGLVLGMSLDETEQEIQTAMGFPGEPSQVHASLNHLRRRVLASIDASEEPSAKINFLAQLFAQSDMAIQDSYLDLLATQYDAGVYQTDFVGDLAGSRSAINTWFEDQTQGMIPDLLPESALSADSRWVVANALYLETPWAHAFPAGATSTGFFTKLDGELARVPLMRHDELNANYGKEEHYAWASVPLRGELQFTVLVPDEGQFEQVLGALDADTLIKTLRSGSSETIKFTFPSFTLDSGPLVFNRALEARGLVRAFDREDAQLEGLTQHRVDDTFLNQVVQKTVIRFSEKGLKAAAATAADGLQKGGAEPDAIYLSVNRPFVFFVQETQTGLPLFAGRVLDPAE